MSEEEEAVAEGHDDDEKERTDPVEEERVSVEHKALTKHDAEEDASEVADVETAAVEEMMVDTESCDDDHGDEKGPVVLAAVCAL